MKKETEDQLPQGESLPDKERRRGMKVGVVRCILTATIDDEIKLVLTTLPEEDYVAQKKRERAGDLFDLALHGWSEEKVLLEQNMLSFPGGGVDKGEDNLLQSISREILQEVGLVIDHEKLESLVDFSIVEQDAVGSKTPQDRSGNHLYRVMMFLYHLSDEELLQLKQYVEAQGRRVEVLTIEKVLEKKDQLRPLTVEAIRVYKLELAFKRGEIDFDSLT